jgi:phytoene synthase
MAPELAAAYERCLQLTRSHYENFPVARLVPRDLRHHVAAIYAFARTADDLADEGWETPEAPSPAARVALLEAYEAQWLLALQGKGDPQSRWAWIFAATSHTVIERRLPAQLLSDLLSAFKQDCTQRRYQSFAQLLDYCRRSANPVGRLILHLHGQAEPEKLRQSDAICTALQLANFWQDVGVDVHKDGRIYMPEEDWAKHGLKLEMFLQPQAPAPLRQCLKQQVMRTQSFFDQGKGLHRSLPWPLSMEIKLTRLGGEAILTHIRRADYDTLTRRPKLGKRDAARLLLACLKPGA